MSGGSEKVAFDGPAGVLEGLWLAGESASSKSVVVLCHPHPLHGGTMETKLVARTARKLAESGLDTLRFNFRGVGASTGTWDEGQGERRDLSAALDFAVSRAPDAALGVFGFSFGAMVGLDVGDRDARVAALAGVAPPVQWFPDRFLQASPKPVLIVGAGQDTIVDPEALAAWASGLGQGSEFRVFGKADHLFGGWEADVAGLVSGFLGKVLGSLSN